MITFLAFPKTNKNNKIMGVGVNWSNYDWSNHDCSTLFEPQLLELQLRDRNIATAQIFKQEL
jgi:hypothetical protein